MPRPTRPANVPGLAERSLSALAAAGLGHKISVGGALGLQHYLDYRLTNDVDAWWDPSATGEDRELVLRNPERRSEAESVRAWFAEELLRAPMD